MCLPLVARVGAVEDSQAEVELLGGDDGRRVWVSSALFPDVRSEQHVLVDRGIIIEVIDAAQAETVLGFYSELTEFWDEVEAEDERPLDRITP